MNRLRSTRANLERGFSLLEILITVVVISIGLLGLAGLQFAGLRAANNAQEHTLAGLLAQDIEERIRANQAGNYTAPIILTTGGTAPTAPTNCSTNNCSALQMYNFDLLQWYQMINTGGPNLPVLPNATINVTNAGTNYAIIITWGDPSGLQTLNAQFSL